MPKIGRPAMKLRVPSIGSSTQTRSAPSRDVAIFLADDAVGRALGLEDRADRGLGGAIGLGDGRGVGLRLHREGGAEEGADRGAGGIGEAVGEGDVGVAWAVAHAGVIASARADCKPC